MRKVFFTIVALITFGLTSCDKIDDNEYTIFAGEVGTWYDDNDIVEIIPTQRVLVEKYTGVRCVNCPDADEIIHSALQRYGEKLIAVAVHPEGSNFAIPFSGEPDLRTADGREWNDFFGFNSYPRALLNRKGENFLPTSNFDGRIDELLNVPAQVGIAVKCERTNSENPLSITVRLSFLQTVSDDLNVTLLISEDSILTTQTIPDGSHQPNYAQNHVLRDVITDVWGDQVDKGDKNGAAGSRRMAQYSYTPNTDWKLENCHIVAFVSKRDTKEILNVAECNVQ